MAGLQPVLAETNWRTLVGAVEKLGRQRALVVLLTPLEPSAYWGKEKIWDTKVNNHNSMIDRKGRVWLAAAVRNSRGSKTSA